MEDLFSILGRRDFEKHYLQEVFNRFIASNLKLHPKKVEFLGHTVLTDGTQSSDDKTKAILIEHVFRIATR